MAKDKTKDEERDPLDLLNDLLNDFDESQQDLTENTDYYDAEYRPASVGVGTPPELRKLMSRVGWARLYVDSLTERLDVEGFRVAGKAEADDDMWAWWQANSLDVDSVLGHTEALIHGRAYITVAAPDPDNAFGVDPEMPIIRVESPTALWADIDPLTRRVKKAIRPIRDRETQDVTEATVYLPHSTVYWVKEQGQWTQDTEQSVDHNLGTVPIVPLLYRSSLSDLEGRSIIIPEIKDAMDHASRTMMNMSSATELMGAPLRMLFGAALEELQGDGDSATKFEAYYARILAFEDSQGHAEQLQAAELQNFVNALQELTRQVASYTGLPPQYLGNTSDNPASAEAIRASESRLVKTAERLCKMFGEAWEEAMRVSMMVMGGDIPSEAYRMETLWRDPATPTYAAKADGVTKLYANGEGVIPLERARVDMGYSAEERKQMRDWDKDNPVNQLAGLYGGDGPVDDEGDVDGSGGLPEETA